MGSSGSVPVVEPFGFDIHGTWEKEQGWEGKFRAVPETEAVDTFQNGLMKYFKLKEDGEDNENNDPEPCLFTQAKFVNDMEHLHILTAQGTLLPSEFIGWGEYVSYVTYSEKVQIDYMRLTGSTYPLFPEVKDAAGDDLEGEWTLYSKGKIVAVAPCNEPRPPKHGWMSPQGLGDDAPARIMLPKQFKLHSHPTDPDAKKYHPSNFIAGKGQGAHREDAAILTGHIHYGADAPEGENDESAQSNEDGTKANEDGTAENGADTSDTSVVPQENKKEEKEIVEEKEGEEVKDDEDAQEADYAEGKEESEEDNLDDEAKEAEYTEAQNTQRGGVRFADDISTTKEIQRVADYVSDNDDADEEDDGDKPEADYSESNDVSDVVDVEESNKEADYAEGGDVDDVIEDTTTKEGDYDESNANDDDDEEKKEGDYDESNTNDDDDDEKKEGDYEEGNTNDDDDEKKEGDYEEGNINDDDDEKKESDYTEGAEVVDDDDEKKEGDYEESADLEEEKEKDYDESQAVDGLDEEKEKDYDEGGQGLEEEKESDYDKSAMQDLEETKEGDYDEAAQPIESLEEEKEKDYDAAATEC